MSLINPPNFIHYLQNEALTAPDKEAFIFLENGEDEQERLSYGSLQSKAQAYAAYLQENAQVGDRILLCYLPGLDFVAAFMACLYAGMIAVPAYPLRNNHHAQRLITIIADCKPALILGTRASLGLMQEQKDFAHLHYVFTEAVPENLRYKPQVIKSETLAFLQYTSGSTGAPKGVMVSHGNILANMQAIHHFFCLSRNDKIVSWLPIQHDMGLIGNLLYTIFCGTTEILMPPNAFLEKPLRWLQAITRYEAYAAGGPNFGFQLCIEKIAQEQLAELDLGCWQTAFNGSEPIRAATLKAFSKKFSVCGFSLQKFLPCYGMAETTLLISGKQHEKKPKIAHVDNELLENRKFAKNTSSKLALVSSGSVHTSYTLQIVNPETKQLSLPQEIGELWVSGPCVSQGYWNKNKLNKEIFKAKLPNDNNAYMRTGDLGYLDGKELYITGRLKDLIILQGRNIYPQDIEMAVELCNPALQAGCSAAFSVEVENQEQLVIATEIKRTYRKTDLSKLFHDIRQAVIQTAEVIPYSIQLLAPTKALRTTSGKIQRQATKARFLAGNLDILASDNLTTKVSAEVSYEQIQHDISSLLAKILGVETIDPEQAFTLSGGTSLEAIIFHQQLQIYVGAQVPLPTTIAFDHPSLQELTSYLYERLTQNKNTSNKDENSCLSKMYADAPELSLPPIEQVARGEKMPLSVNEQAAWVATQEKSNNVYLNMKTLLFINTLMDKEQLEVALNHIVNKHEILRTTYHQDGLGNLYREIHNELKTTIEFHDLTTLMLAEQENCIRYLAQQNEHKLFLLDTLPLFELTLLRISADRYTLIFCMHHIIGDGSSVALFLNELMSVYLSLPAPKVVSSSWTYADYATWQHQICQQGLLAPLISYWENELAAAEDVRLPYDKIKKSISSDKAGLVTIRINKNNVQEYLRFSSKNRISLQILFMGAFLQLLKTITFQEKFLIETILSNRITTQHQNVLGALAVDGIALYSLTAHHSLTEFLNDLLQQMLTISKLSQDCGSLLYNAVARKLPGKPTVAINFHAQHYGADLPIPVKIDASYFSRNSMPGCLDLFLEIWPSHDEVVVDFIYRQSLFKKKTIEGFAHQYIKILEGFVDSYDTVTEAREAS
jgi:acyl-CoA synthetase (AMP-forming)/AMP-acid ligase II